MSAGTNWDCRHRFAAHKIERFVREYIVKKDLNVGFGSAEETAKSREGDEYHDPCNRFRDGRAKPHIGDVQDRASGIYGVGDRTDRSVV